MADGLTLNEFLKQQEDFYEERVKFHPANAFCGTASEEEMKHTKKLWLSALLVFDGAKILTCGCSN